MSKENKEIKEEFEAINERFEKQEDNIKELKEQLVKIQIMANAKAVIVPEGKGVFWTNKVEVLERRLDQVEESHREELGRHIDLIGEHEEQIDELKKRLIDTTKLQGKAMEILTNKLSEIESMLKEGYGREIEWIELYGNYRTYPNPAERKEFYRKQIKALSGEKEKSKVSIVVHNGDRLNETEQTDSKPDGFLINKLNKENTEEKIKKIDTLLESPSHDKPAEPLYKWDENNICSKCVFQYSKHDWCSAGHQQYSLAHQLTKCEEFKPKSTPNDDNLMEMANIEQIIEVYDNGHEHAFEPESYHNKINQELIAEFIEKLKNAKSNKTMPLWEIEKLIEEYQQKLEQCAKEQLKI